MKGRLSRRLISKDSISVKTRNWRRSLKCKCRKEWLWSLHKYSSSRDSYSNFPQQSTKHLSLTSKYIKLPRAYRLEKLAL